MSVWRYDRLRVLCLVAGLVNGAAGLNQAQSPDVPADHAERAKSGLKLFREHVRPLLLRHCVDCHGGKATKAGFDLTTRKALLDSESVQGTAAESRLMALIRHEEDPGMPFQAEKLPAEAIARIAKWIDFGAPYDKPLVEKAVDSGRTTMQVTNAHRDFWSFQRFRPVARPAVAHGSWPRNEIDHFVLARLEGARLQPGPSADRRTLVRRAALDLLGLPPSPQQVAEFVDDASPHAYSKLIDRLLQSEHYGERWARHWMDVARFAESSGFEHDSDRTNAYHYRDFLIEAFNEDIPWDGMVRWQIAGDELRPNHRLAVKATGFLAAGVFPTQLTEAEFEMARYDELDDRIGTLGVAFLGLSTGCARCHDHKYDPIPSRDYYRLVAVFGATIRSEQRVAVNHTIYRDQRDKWEQQQAALLKSWEQAAENEKKRKQQELDAHLQREPRDGKVLALVCTEGVKPLKHNADGRGYPHVYPQVYYLQRGDPKQKDGVAEPGFLQVLTRQADLQTDLAQPAGNETKRSHLSYQRTRLGRWITNHEQGAGHLLARVIVNRLWQHHFGRGIVATPNDFGFQGARPTHPELLDWLAQDLITHGWQLKRLHKLIMTSATYRQIATVERTRQTDNQTGADEDGLETVSYENASGDMEDVYLWRFPARRLTAEAIRDSLLVVSGQLDPTMYGPGSLDESMRRRSVYFTIKRSQPIPMMQVFDWPEHLVSIGRRPQTTIAPQALSLLNSPHVRRSAEGFARRIHPNSAVANSAALQRAYWIALSREPTAVETERGLEFLKEQTRKYAGTADPAHLALTDFCQSLMSSNEFLYLP